MVRAHITGCTFTCRAPPKRKQTAGFPCSQIALGGQTFYTGNATYTDAGPLHPWAQSASAQQGMSASILTAGGQEFARDIRAAAMLAVRNGVLVYEGYANGSTALEANNVHSVAKSVTRPIIFSLCPRRT